LHVDDARIRSGASWILSSFGLIIHLWTGFIHRFRKLPSGEEGIKSLTGKKPDIVLLIINYPVFRELMSSNISGIKNMI
jgi:hypothetical protein